MKIGFTLFGLAGFLAAVLTVSGVVSFAQTRALVQAPAGKSISQVPLVFFLHGFKGREGSFCDLPEILKTRFQNKANVGASGAASNGGPQVELLAYATDSDDEIVLDSNDHPVPVDNRNVALFSKQVHLQIAGTFLRLGLPENHPFIIIAHSQGGLVATDWYHDYISKQQCRNEYYKICPSNLKMMITLGTPFVGSPVASFFKDNALTDFVNSLQKVGVPALVPRQQLDDLALASPLILSTADKIKAIHSRVLNNETELVHIGGDDGTLIESLLFNEKIPPYQSFQWDGVVPMFSSFSVTQGENSQKTFKSLLDKIFYYPIQGSHAWGKTDIACSTKAQEKDKLVIQLIKKHFARILEQNLTSQEQKVLANKSQYEKELLYFHAVVRGKLPKDWNRTYPLKHFRISDRSENPSFEFKNSRPDLIANLLTFPRYGTKFFGVNNDPKLVMNEISFYTTGKFKAPIANKYDQANPHLQAAANAQVEFNIHSRWFEPQSVLINVAPGFSTIKEIELKPRQFPNDTCFRGSFRRLKKTSSREEMSPPIYYWKADRQSDALVGNYNASIRVINYFPPLLNRAAYVEFQFAEDSAAQTTPSTVQTSETFITTEDNIRLRGLCTDKLKPIEYDQTKEPFYL